MTADERLEALLNRAGQTISDLPDEYSENKAEAVFNLFEFDGELDATAYIIHLAAIIDRMEAALENTLGERDWLLREYGQGNCHICKHTHVNDDDCMDFEGCAFEYERLPEDWRIDDEID